MKTNFPFLKKLEERDEDRLAGTEEIEELKKDLDKQFSTVRDARMEFEAEADLFRKVLNAHGGDEHMADDVATNFENIEESLTMAYVALDRILKGFE